MSGNQGAEAQAMEIEALRQIGATLQALNTGLVEDRRLLHNIHERLIRIESNRMEVEVAALSVRLDKAVDRLVALETSEARRDGAVGLVGWISKHAPWLLAVVVSAAALIGADKVGR